MKKILLVVSFVCAGILSKAQSNKEDIDMIQAMYGKEKKEIVAGFIKLEGAQKDAFWKLYDQYEAERKALGRRRIALIEKYANVYDSLTDQRMDAIMKEMFFLGTQTDKLIETYYNKMKLPAGYKAAGQFSQLESYLLSMVRVSLLESIPFFGELDKGKKE